MLVSYMREDGPEAFQDGNFIELPMLQRGLLWGIGRLIPRYRQTLAAMGIAVISGRISNRRMGTSGGWPSAVSCCSATGWRGRNVTFSSRIGIASRSTPGMASSPAPSPTSFDRGGRERNSLAVTMEPAGPITAGPASEE